MVSCPPLGAGPAHIPRGVANNPSEPGCIGVAAAGDQKLGGGFHTRDLGVESLGLAHAISTFNWLRVASIPALRARSPAARCCGPPYAPSEAGQIGVRPYRKWASTSRAYFAPASCSPSLRGRWRAAPPRLIEAGGAPLHRTRRCGWAP